MTLTAPVLAALGWRLVDRELVAREALPGARSVSDDAWICRRLSEGPHGLPHQLAAEALRAARALAPEPLDGLALIADATLRLEHGLPRVNSEEAWDPLCRVVDPDLVALAAVSAKHDLDPRVPASQGRLRWPPVLRAHQTVFHGVCAEALAEVHAHLSACLPTCLHWSLLVCGAIPPEALWSHELHMGPDDSAWRDALMDAARRLAALATLGEGAERPSIPRTGPLPDGLLARCLLTPARLDQDLPRDEWPLRAPIVGGTAAWGLLVPERLALLRALWMRRHELLREEDQADLLAYVRLRCAFNVLMSQPPGHRGLNHFRVWVSRRSAVWSRPTRGSEPRRRNAQRAATLAMELVLETWLLDQRGSGPGPCPPLDLELRACLPLRGRETGLFFEALARATRRVLRRWRYPELRVGIIHHAIKAPGREDGRAALEELRTLWDLLEERPELRPLLVGIDAASDELACPPRTFSAAFRWVRDRLDLEANPDTELPIRLGFTFHAGEDFRDLLTGIRHVDEAAHLLSMRPGDRLGHALALSWPVDEFYVERHHAFPTVADHALDLLWASALLGSVDGHGDLARDARDRLLRLLADCGVKTGVDLSALVAALDVDEPYGPETPRGQPLWSRVGALPLRDAPARALLEGELLDVLRVPERARDAFAPRPARPVGWRRLVQACQDVVRKRILDRGLIVEINPSSNRLVGGFSSIDRLPYPRLNRPGPRAPGQPANIPLSLGTDDAGIFHTSLRREYELVGRGALEAGFDLPDVYAWLDEIRRTSRRACFIRNTAPSGRDLARWMRRLLP